MTREEKAKQICKMISDYQDCEYPFEFTDDELDELLEKEYICLINGKTDTMIDGMKKELIKDIAEDDFTGAEMILKIIIEIVKSF